MLEVELNNFKYQLLCLYRAPKNKINTFLRYLNNILEHNKNLLIVGDINIDLLRRDNATKKYNDVIYLNSYEIKNYSHKITRRNSKNTSTGTLIDHVIGSKNLLCKVKLADIPISDHKMLDLYYQKKLNSFQLKK